MSRRTPHDSFSAPRAEPRPRIPTPAKIGAAQGERAVVQCYRGPFHHIVFRGAGLAGYNEGRYADNPRRTHVEAHWLQNKKIVAHALFGAETGEWTEATRPRLLDVGCGNGELLEVATQLGVEAVGITLVPEQVDECRRRGLTAYLLDVRDIGPEWFGQFDGVVLKGTVEHYVQPRHVVEGRDGAEYQQLFALLRRVLNPASPSGRVTNSTIKYLRRPDPRDLMRSPFAHKFGSDAYHWAWLHHMYGGWHPVPGELAEHARPHFRLEKEEDISDDYRLSAEYCLGTLRKAALRSPRMWRETLMSLGQYPTTTLTHVWGLYVSQSTNWYFRGPNPPTKGMLQTWKIER